MSDPLIPIANSPIFENLRPDQAQQVCNLHLNWARKDKETLLVRAGDRSAPLLTLSRGTAFKYCSLPNGGRQILSLYIAGDTIGLDVLLTGAPAYPVHSASAVIYSTMDKQQAAQLANSASWFRDQAWNALVRERAAAEMALIRLGQCDAEQRVASIILEIYQRLAERKLAANNEFTLELTQLHLADLLGLTAIHLNRVLGRLKAKKLLAISGQRVTILDPGALEFLTPVRFSPIEKSVLTR